MRLRSDLFENEHARVLSGMLISFAVEALDFDYKIRLKPISSYAKMIPRLKHC